MKVKELIEKLKDYNSDNEVFCIYEHATHDIYGVTVTDSGDVHIECNYDYKKFNEQVNE